MIDAANKTLGLRLTSEDDYFAHIDETSRRLVNDRLNGDPELLWLASAMAACLKDGGYTVADTTPWAISRRGQDVFVELEDRLGREQRPDVPGAPLSADKREVMVYRPTLTPEEARPYLNKEIKAALDDLECGKAFYAVYAPRESALDQQLADQLGW